VDHNLVSEIATFIIAALGLAVLAQLWGQPLILAYLAAPALLVHSARTTVTHDPRRQSLPTPRVHLD
jgi:Kef-type K+ transport system membrane component KefB